jgi:Protein of unknown function (DUF2971)
LDAGGTKGRADLLSQAFARFYQTFDEQHALDTYVFCASEHDPANTDGLLSMWRGYGQHGNGAALIFDTAKITPVPTSPLIAARVSYASDQDRVQQLQAMIADWATITKRERLPEAKLYLASYSAFMTIKTFALTTKHSGFSEEREWRIIYYPERDPQGLLKGCLVQHWPARR